MISRDVILGLDNMNENNPNIRGTKLYVQNCLQLWKLFKKTATPMNLASLEAKFEEIMLFFNEWKERVERKYGDTKHFWGKEVSGWSIDRCRARWLLHASRFLEM